MADYNERCWKHAVMGLFVGFAMGGNIGCGRCVRGHDAPPLTERPISHGRRFFFGTIEGAHGEIVGRTFGEQLRIGFGRCVSRGAFPSMSLRATAFLYASVATPALRAPSRKGAFVPR